MTTATSDTGTALAAAERALQGLVDEEAGGAAALRQVAARGDLDAVRELQARGALLPILLPAARERALRARLAHGATERTTAAATLATARADAQRAGDAMRAAEAALFAAQQACYGPGLWLADAERRIELLHDQRRATKSELAALLGLAVGDDGELHDAAADEDADHAA